MIYIKENKTKKQPGKTSLFVKFDYRPDIVEIVKSIGYGAYSKKDTTWEFPCTQLSLLIQKLQPIDDIDLELLSIKEIAILNVLCNDDKNVVPEYWYTIPQVIDKIKYIYKDILELLNVKQNYVLNFMSKLLKYDDVVKTEISPKKIYVKFNNNGIELKSKAKKHSLKCLEVKFIHTERKIVLYQCMILIIQVTI